MAVDVAHIDFHRARAVFSVIGGPPPLPDRVTPVRTYLTFLRRPDLDFLPPGTRTAGMGERALIHTSNLLQPLGGSLFSGSKAHFSLNCLVWELVEHFFEGIIPL